MSKGGVNDLTLVGKPLVVVFHFGMLPSITQQLNLHAEQLPKQIGTQSRKLRQVGLNVGLRASLELLLELIGQPVDLFQLFLWLGIGIGAIARHAITRLENLLYADSVQFTASERQLHDPPNPLLGIAS